MAADGDDETQKVGYKKPPVKTRFKKGRSGNPRGRPRKPPSAPKVITADIGRVILDEAYRSVSIREGDKVIELPVIRAVLRSLGVAAMKGSRLAQVAMKEMVQAEEQRQVAEKLAYVQSVVDYKKGWEDAFDHCDRRSIPRPEVVPHPDDIVVDYHSGEVRFIGPLDDHHKSRWDQMRERRGSALQEIANNRQLMEEEPDLRIVLEDDIQFEQRLIDMIDAYMPDEQTRRSPGDDPERRLAKFHRKYPDFVKRHRRLGNP